MFACFQALYFDQVDLILKVNSDVFTIQSFKKYIYMKQPKDECTI